MSTARPASKRVLQTNWLYRWLNASCPRAGVSIAQTHHSAMVRRASIQRPRHVFSLETMVPALSLRSQQPKCQSEHINAAA